MMVVITVLMACHCRETVTLNLLDEKLLEGVLDKYLNLFYLPPDSVVIHHHKTAHLKKSSSWIK